ncbi:hypothetical protein BN946_scf185007.g179 [Trametes cinnabarina]|uniref:Uncharacterized protein n=1 Tax=Pycnoporus cinnabarinus TaxID=5643 RepID=A0A060SFG9_PYCCI|nr:hypothetical protein BN946_scf185007.g179 [Trametes cinnabarina]
MPKRGRGRRSQQPSVSSSTTRTRLQSGSPTPRPKTSSNQTPMEQGSPLLRRSTRTTVIRAGLKRQAEGQTPATLLGPPGALGDQEDEARSANTTMTASPNVSGPGANPSSIASTRRGTPSNDLQLGVRPVDYIDDATASASVAFAAFGELLAPQTGNGEDAHGQFEAATVSGEAAALPRPGMDVEVHGRFQTPTHSFPPATSLASNVSPLTDVSSDHNNEGRDDDPQTLRGYDLAGSRPIPGSPSSTMHLSSTSQEPPRPPLQSPLNLIPPINVTNYTTRRDVAWPAITQATQAADVPDQDDGARLLPDPQSDPRPENAKDARPYNDSDNGVGTGALDRRDVRANTGADVPTDDAADIQTNHKMNFNTNDRIDVEANVGANAQVDGRANPPADVRANVRTDVQADVHPYVQADVQADVPTRDLSGTSAKFHAGSGVEERRVKFLEENHVRYRANDRVDMRREDSDEVDGEHPIHVVGDIHHYAQANGRADARTDRHADLRSKAHTDSGVHLHQQALVDGNDDVRMDDNNQIHSLRTSHETHAQASKSDDTATSNIPHAPSANSPLPVTTALDLNPQAEPAGAVDSHAYGPLHGFDDRMLVDSDVEQSCGSNPVMSGYDFAAIARPHTVPSGATSASCVDIERLTDSAGEPSSTAAYPIVYTNPHPNVWNNPPANVDIALQKPQRPTVDANDLDDVFGLPSTSQAMDRNDVKGADHQASRPAGPSAAKANLGWYSDDDAANGVLSDSTSPAVGRISNATLQRVRDTYEDVVQLAKNVQAETGLSTGQVFDQWFTTYAGSGTRSKGNMWNLYNIYFKTHASEELDRISLDRKKPSYRELCYSAFKADNGEKAQEILTTFQGIQQVTEGKKQTVAQRTRAFKQYSARVTNLMDSFETHHGFSGAVVLVGNSVNSDGHLAAVHMTKHAEGLVTHQFFEDKCRAPSDVLIGHMKSHVYNRVSNTMIDFTWEGEPEAGPSTPAKGKQRASDKHAKVASQHRPNEASHGGASSARPAASSPVKAAQSEDDEDLLIIRKDKPKFICQKFRKLLAVNASLFPWKTLAQVLATNGAWMDNWPDDVPWPGEPVGKQTKSRRPTKGITTLKSAEINALLASLKAPVHRIRFHKCQNDHEKLDLVRGVLPVIYGAPPPSTSIHKRGRRLFANGKTDREGHRRLEPTDSDAEQPSPARSDRAEPRPRSSSPSAPSQPTPPCQLRPRERRAVRVGISTTPKKAEVREPDANQEVINLADIDTDTDTDTDDDFRITPRDAAKKAQSKRQAPSDWDSGLGSEQPRTPPTAAAKGKMRALEVPVHESEPVPPVRVPSSTVDARGGAQCGVHAGPTSSSSSSMPKVDGRPSKRPRLDNIDASRPTTDPGVAAKRDSQLKPNAHAKPHANLPTNAGTNVGTNLVSNSSGNVSSKVNTKDVTNVATNTHAGLHPNVTPHAGTKHVASSSTDAQTTRHNPVGIVHAGNSTTLTGVEGLREGGQRKSHDVAVPSAETHQYHEGRARPLAIDSGTRATVNLSSKLLANSTDITRRGEARGQHGRSNSPMGARMPDQPADRDGNVQTEAKKYVGADDPVNLRANPRADGHLPLVARRNAAVHPDSRRDSTGRVDSQERHQPGLTTTNQHKGESQRALHCDSAAAETAMQADQATGQGRMPGDDSVHHAENRFQHGVAQPMYYQQYQPGGWMGPAGSYAYGPAYPPNTHQPPPGNYPPSIHQGQFGGYVMHNPYAGQPSGPTSYQPPPGPANYPPPPGPINYQPPPGPINYQPPPGPTNYQPPPSFLPQGPPIQSVKLLGITAMFQYMPCTAFFLQTITSIASPAVIVQV